MFENFLAFGSFLSKMQNFGLKPHFMSPYQLPADKISFAVLPVFRIVHKIIIKLKRSIIRCRVQSTERRYWTELNWHDLVFNALTNGHVVMRYSRHRLTASMAYATTLTYAPNNDALLAHRSVRHSKLNRVRSVHFS